MFCTHLNVDNYGRPLRQHRKTPHHNKDSSVEIVLDVTVCSTDWLCCCVAGI